MKILITGAGGQLGKEWVDFCERNSIAFEAFNSSELDITDAVQLKNKIETVSPDVIINCAGYTKVDQAEDEAALADLINHQAVQSLAGICKQKGIKLVHFSTDYVFSGADADREKFPEGYPEDHQTAPLNVYGETKRRGEIAISDSGCEHLIIRVSWLCGQYGHNFVKTMLRLGSEREELSIVNDQFGCPTFTQPVVEQTMKLIKSGEQGIFHLSSEGMITWYEFAKEIFRNSEVKVSLIPVSSSEFKTRAKRPFFSKLSTEKAEHIEGLIIKNWKEYLKSLMEQIK